ncbi:Peroxisome biosynthesis protein PAS1 [Wickerhamiella sorbophila]|uniref:Peroxisomal ATPase PEX1 n=1 Tax=Wickerhamiella sorbophila TaxID=45607 RepID=A0A2T0FG69_9ASCO|nr:Peroxisome biosynthesis protein PAS1 [Wickerhamiella sorbophila]PRT53993.1 Peroxisome biosynthesis protein PAS1 [Wickerhamiella sorbophila]
MTVARVVYVPSRTNFVNLPTQLANTLANSDTPVQKIVVQVDFKGTQNHVRRPNFVGWSGMASRDDKTLEIDPTFAQNIGLPHGANVSISVTTVKDGQLAERVFLEPLTPADWDIVETHAGLLEDVMINQVRVVSPSCNITVYPTATAIAALKVTHTIPDLPHAAREVFVAITENTEVVIAPKLKPKNGDQTAPSGQTKQNGSAPAHKPETVVLRAASFPFANAPATRKLQLCADTKRFGGVSHVSVSVIQPSLSAAAPEPSSPKDPSIVTPAKTVLAELVHADFVSMSYGLSCALGVPGVVSTLLQISSAPTLDSGTLTLHPYTTSSAMNSLKAGKSADEEKKNISEKLYETLDLSYAGNGLVVPPVPDILPQGGIFEAPFEYGDIKGIKLGSEQVLAESSVMPLPDSVIVKPARAVVGRDSLLTEIEDAIVGGTGTLVYGSRGCGKSSVVDYVCRKLEEQLIRPLRFDVGALMEKPVPTVKEALRRVFLEAAWHSPALVVIDDLDKLIPAELEHSDSSRTVQLAEIFNGLAHEILSSRPVTLLATAQAKEALHSSLTSSHVFEELIHLRSPDKTVREAVLTEVMAALEITGNDEFDILDVVGETEGYQPGDLWVLGERVISTLAIESNEMTVSTDNFKAAASDYTPASLRGVKLEKGNATWSEIGGLEEVKRVILETLEWPTKYAPIFANCPLRLRSGLLLYGYPGCGKTLMASAVAAQCGLNFITVKGPEILNKYIGASEQSVRDLFDRAQAAKPCVLFFDEFDSIAPKRGHDSTGVTDRVVNQMLTQMDGAEGLDGVYVLAATSRPDLIDSALLRPGRLDKSLLCDMPNASDREQIMATAKAKMSLAPDVDLSAIAARTEGFSGADLQALMYNAYLDAIHERLDTKGEQGLSTEKTNQELELFQLNGRRDVETVRSFLLNSADSQAAIAPQTSSVAKAGDPVILTTEHLEKSLQQTKPSISAKEVLKLKHIYDQFVSDRDGEMPPGTSSTGVGERVTLS